MSEVPESLRQALAGRYEIERPIGQGGMATVYVARDVKHGREVAVKVLRPDLSAALGTERFLREIQIAARLQHPHIVLLIDSGEAAGLLYYVMPFINGESLRARLEREGRLAPEAALAIAREVGDALDYANRHGVVHRDIKPENILLADGHAVVADFGVAKALSEASDKSLTRTGYPVGTVGYMSPEQAAGFTDLNERSDVFSLGCVIYEMLVGRVPGMWPSDDASRVLRFLEAPPEHRAVLDQLPGAVEQALVRALALRPERRLESSRALIDAITMAFGDRPRYSDAQVRGIVARAAELEATTPTTSGALSLGGIQQLAADVGIPPEHVDRAARELSRRAPMPPVRSNAFVGSPSRILVERFIEGEAAPDDYPILVDEIRMMVGNAGQSSTLGRALAWRTAGAANGVGRQVSVSITPNGGKTRLVIDENLGQLAGGMFGGVVGGVGSAVLMLGMALGAGAFHSVPLGFLLGGSGIGTVYGSVRTFFKWTHQKRREELEALADRLGDHVMESARAARPRLGRPS